ncbi:MAG: beta-propeller fold lactonase family protein [Novosphingobium sp.]|nr:beta-propeller fold lactonase family protein [Novosphingobium sp.]MCP5403805.1 beta-propeller fold lactonase family protein [Novosphingobium sp.]
MALALILVPCAPPAQAGTLVVGNKTENTVSFLDLDSGQERARVETGPAPHEVAISPDGKQAAVVAYGGTTIDIFDVATARRMKRIDLSPNEAPHGIAWLRTGRIVIAAEKSKSVVIVDPRRGLIRSIPTDQAGTHMLVVSPDRRRAYASNIMAGTVSVIDLRERKKLSDITVGGYPEGLALTPDGRQLWVGDDSGGRIRVVDLATMETIDTLPADPVPVRIAISPDGKTAICSNIGSGTLNVFDVATRKPLRTISVSGAREAVQVTIAFSRDGKLVYVAETGRDTIAEVDFATGEVLRRLTAGKGGDGLGIAP